tara:strand:+ start:136 stop:378 length:243 start_codon:yes stop_codon:yes gene_type:complete
MEDTSGHARQMAQMEKEHRKVLKEISFDHCAMLGLQDKLDIIGVLSPTSLDDVRALVEDLARLTHKARMTGYAIGIAERG